MQLYLLCALGVIAGLGWHLIPQRYRPGAVVAVATITFFTGVEMTYEQMNGSVTHVGLVTQIILLQFLNTMLGVIAYLVGLLAGMPIADLFAWLTRQQVGHRSFV